MSLFGEAETRLRSLIGVKQRWPICEEVVPKSLGLPTCVLIEGPPGCGKRAVVHAVARSLAIRVTTVSVGELQPGHLSRLVAAQPPCFTICTAWRALNELLALVHMGFMLITRDAAVLVQRLDAFLMDIKDDADEDRESDGAIMNLLSTAEALRCHYPSVLLVCRSIDRSSMMAAPVCSLTCCHEIDCYCDSCKQPTSACTQRIRRTYAIAHS